jgi:hypothetical protein
VFRLLPALSIEILNNTMGCHTSGVLNSIMMMMIIIIIIIIMYVIVFNFGQTFAGESESSNKEKII